jgi:hypothetical protein
MTTRSRPIPVRLLATLVASALALVLGLVAGIGAAPAGAHEGDAVITIEAVHPAGMSIHYIVRVTWENDGHPAADATVTATGVAADGTQLTPVALAPVDSDGRYAGAVEYPAPGSWTVRVTSIDPTGTAEQAQEVTAPPTTEPAEGGTDVTTGPADGGSEAGSDGFAAADDDTGASGEQAAGSGSDDDGMPVYLMVAAAVVVLIGAATAVNIIRRNRPDLTARDRTATPGGPGAGSATSDPPTGTASGAAGPAKSTPGDTSADT